MATLTRSVPTGTVEASQLLEELNAEAGPISTACSSVAVWPGQPDDSVVMEFDSDPTKAAVDAVLSAHPLFAPGLAATVELTANGAFATVWSTLLAEGESVEIKARLRLRLGSAADVEPVSIDFRDMALRRTGEGAVVPNAESGGASAVGWLPQARARLSASGNRVDLQVSSRRAGTARVSGAVTKDPEVASP
jgi:hypothetical protein